MRSSSSLSPRVMGVSLFVLCLIALTGNALVHFTYLGSGQGGNDTARSIAVDSIGNAYVTGPECAPCPILNSAVKSVGQGAPSNSATATPAVTLLDQFPQKVPKLVDTSAGRTTQIGFSTFLSPDRNTAIVGGAGDGDSNGAVWVSAASAPAVLPGADHGQSSSQAFTAGANATPEVASAVRFAISPAVSDLHEQPRGAVSGQADEAIVAMPEGQLPRRKTPALAARMENEAIQTSATSLIPVPSQSFDGLNSQDNATAFGYRVYPPDPNGDVGTNHYVQGVNLLVRVYSKTGTALTAPFKMSSLFAALGGVCSTNDNGDPIVLYDPLADRWLLSQLAFANFYSPPYHQCIAISKTSDPTGAYFLYDFVMPGSNLNDYPHFGVWSDAYYMSDNQFLNGFTFKGAGAFAFDRAKMLAGNSTASYIYFDLGTNYGGMLPADLDGLTAPPTGTPNYFAMFQATLFGDSSNSMRLFSFHADFATPANSTFSERPESPIAVAAFDPRSPSTENVIEQPNPATTKMYLDPLQDRLMHRLAYRNLGGTRESLVVTHTVNVGPDPTTVAGHQAAIRYYEFRRSLPAGSFTVPEQATFAPDTDNRWMGSAAMDSQGNIAVGYSVSSKSTFPSIRYAGRLASDPPNGLFQGEAVLAIGSGVQRGTAGRWGDYSTLSVDPSDDCTFWYTTEYYTAASQASSEVGWLTRIGSFKFPNCGAQISQGTVTGTITDPVAGATMSGAVVSFSPGGYSAVRSASGTYSATVPTGTYTLTASATHRVSQSVSGVVVTNGGTTTVNFSLPFPAGTGLLTGHVRNARTNAAFVNAVVTVSPGGSSSTTDEDGFYELYIPAGTNTVTASAPDFLDSSATGVVIADQGITTRDFSLQPSAHLLAQLGEPSVSNVKLADLDGDGKSEVIVTTLENNPSFPGPQGGGRIHVLSSSGNELPGWPVTLNGRPLNNTAAVGDIDGDGHLDIVVETFGNVSEPSGTDPRKVWAFTTTGVIKLGFPVPISSTPIQDGWSTGLFSNGALPSPALADLNSDGVPEIIVISMGSGFGTDGGAVVAFKGDGTLLFKTILPRSVPPGRFFDEFPHYSVPMIGNLIGDASPEIVVGVSAQYGAGHMTFYALTAQGAFLPGWPVTLGPPLTNAGASYEYGALGDLYRDGRDELIVTYQESSSSPQRLYVFDGSGQVVTGFPKDLPGNEPVQKFAVPPALADVDHDGFPDIVLVVSDQIHNYLVAYNRFGQQLAQTAIASGFSPFVYYYFLRSLGLAEDNTGQLCAVFPVSVGPGANQLQLNAIYLNGQLVPGYPITLPNLCESPFCQAASSVSLARDSGSSQVYSVLIDQSGNVRRWDIFNSTRPIPWSQFQHDAANTGLARTPQTLTVTRLGTGTGSVSSSVSGIGCGATCSADFNSGTVVALTASANAGSSFTGWSGDCQGSGGCQVTMSQARNVTATFTLNQVQFNAASYGANELGGVATITANRIGETSSSASVDYATSDGSASERSDYLAAVGTLRFAPGETSKTINVFVVDDAFGEATETFNVTLSSPIGVGLGSPTVTTITINSDESVDGLNPVKEASFNTDFFVRQHYIDFFNREADAPGLAFWKNQIDECTTQACRDIRKINVSAAFFLSIEFQQTGYLVYKANQASFNSGEFLKLRDFLPDLQEIGRGVVIGQPGADAQLEANKQKFFLDFVQRAKFVDPTAYPTTMTAAQFVDKLNANTFDPLNTGSGGALSSSQRDALVSQLAPNPSSPALRSQVLRSVSENSLFNTRQSNKAFVLMQYFGYLRRNPNDPPEAGLDFAGYNFWLGKLNQFGGNFVNAEMVKAFIVSGEYQQRFGP